MGIQEHFAEHDHEDLKLKDLSLNIKERQREESIFSPEDVTGNDFELMLLVLRDYIKSFYQRTRESKLSIWLAKNILIEASSMAILLPKRFEDIEAINHTLFGQLKECFIEEGFVIEQGLTPNVFDFLAQTKIIFPKEFSERIEVPEKIYQKLKRKAEQDPTDQNKLDGILRGIFDFKILYPEKFKELNLKDDLFDKINERLKSSISQSLDFRDLLGITNRIIHLKTAFPDQVKSSDYPGLVDAIKNEIEKIRSNEQMEAWPMAQFFACLKMLDTDDIKMTDQGIKCIKIDASYKQEKARRPERKTF